MNRVIALILFCFLVSCGGDDDNTDYTLEKYKEYIVGNWVPDDEEIKSILIFHRDKTGVQYFPVEKIDDVNYYTSGTFPIISYLVKKDDKKNVYIVEYVYERMVNEKPEIYKDTINIEGLTSNTLFTDSNKFKKIPTINIRE